MTEDVILIVEDMPRCAQWQTQAARYVFPDKQIIHARNLKEAHDTLTNERVHVCGLMTDNGYPLVRGGERIGSKSIEGGAGTLLIKQLRAGRFGDDYHTMRVVWHTAHLDDHKVQRILSYEDASSKGLTACFEKDDGPEPYIEMAEFLKH